jgi:sporulation-control protein spo0M
MTHSRDAWVIEKVSDVQASTAKWGMNEGRPLFTQEGLVKLYIGVPQSRIQTGDELLVNVHIKNETAKKIQGIRLKLVKKLLILETDQSIRIITENVRQMEYKGQETTFPPMTDKNLTLTLHVPVRVSSD